MKRKVNMNLNLSGVAYYVRWAIGSGQFAQMVLDRQIKEVIGAMDQLSNGVEVVADEVNLPKKRRIKVAD
ncbi:hypothetical protein TROPICALSUN_68 [Erwinia phage vB_EamM_TropicalSun]|jgi:hypothetical protein|uniref:Uncharacterized protein n=2 Tax=Myosmarvirus myosmar TaxID=2846183 RepID=A0A5B9NIP5_9CAUD|nr:hypothetical protein HWC56_gp027 [Serratia phage MyoSmar]QEG09476.1 hypothetical protein CPT_MyoSmar_027 [Serratia phage MyoSmar]QEG13858.1 hypothetical protein TROPICALSUN_68 [Erwinia phage vB_EamM_TropicalSun]